MTAGSSSQSLIPGRRRSSTAVRTACGRCYERGVAGLSCCLTWTFWPLVSESDGFTMTWSFSSMPSSDLELGAEIAADLDVLE